ncbi:hypothetical protein C2845_PM09G15120 [Panicum miliaceum]|uniref:Uncharacterized protein n=1 Tax=Panicum miliaceum TaxID=4540 RepID=A0A3L6RYP5_PANMI|nr:hypothetical protein C2845_PM09G15120 [Panicum miliaceum]
MVGASHAGIFISASFPAAGYMATAGVAVNSPFPRIHQATPRVPRGRGPATVAFSPPAQRHHHRPSGPSHGEIQMRWTSATKSRPRAPVTTILARLRICRDGGNHIRQVGDHAIRHSCGSAVNEIMHGSPATPVSHGRKAREVAVWSWWKTE